MFGVKKLQRLRKIFDDAVKSLNPDLRTQAFTHISYSNECGNVNTSNERLEFLGDAVISMAVGVYLYKNYPQMLEGDLTRMRASLVSGASLAKTARAVCLEKHLMLGRGEEKTGGRKRPRIIGGAFEAFVGAYFLQHDWHLSYELVEGLLKSSEMKEVPVDPKTMLQEIVQQRSTAKLEYVVLNIKGPDHLPQYTIGCNIDGRRVSVGKGQSKKEAEEDAARNWLKSEGLIS